MSTQRATQPNGQLPKMSTERLEANIERIVERDRAARGLGVDEIVITRKATPDELLALAERDMRRPIDQLLDQPVRRPRVAEPARSLAMTAAQPPTTISKPTTTRTALESRVAPHVHAAHAGREQSANQTLTSDPGELTRLGFVRVDPRPPKPVNVDPVVTLGKGGMFTLSKVAMEAFGRLERVAILIHPTSREIALVRAESGPVFPMRHLRTGNANVAAKVVARQLDLLGTAHVYVPKQITAGFLLIDLVKDERRPKPKGRGGQE